MKAKQLLEGAGVLLVVAVVEGGFFLFAGSFSAYVLWFFWGTVIAAVLMGIGAGVSTLLSRSTERSDMSGTAAKEAD